MKKLYVRILLAVALLITCVVAAIHLSTRTDVETGSLQIMMPSKTVTVKLSELDLQPVEGQIVNGKGEVSGVTAMGISMEDLLSGAGAADYQTVRVFAGDEYMAELSAAEIHGERDVYLIQEEDMIRLIVFGDRNSKRNVSNAARVEVS